jgi:uroporphyrinogen decarboxylase
MNGKELIFKTLRHENTARVPWVPFAGVHAGKLVGATARQILTEGDVLLKALLEVNKLYRPDGQPIMFDLQIEAEILGCELLWAEDNPPSVKSHPLSETNEIPCLCMVPEKSDGRIPLVLDVMRKMKEEVGDTTALYGLTCGPFTLASHLRGTNIFMDMYDDPEYVIKLIGFANEVNKKMAEYYMEAGMDVIAVVDPLVSQISPEHFEEFLGKPYTEFFDFVRNRDALSSFFVCGNATRNIEEMCKTNPDSISVDENVDMVTAKEITDKYNIVLGGNIPLTTVMLYGTQQDNMKYTIELLDKLSHKNLIIAPGCDMPYDVPIENTIAVQQAVKETENVRKMIENYEVVEDDINVVLPDYDSLEKTLIEVFTLDSATCAACTYMMNAANDAKEKYGDNVDIVEYKFTVKENIARVKKIGVKNLPSMYINGQLAYSSIIPSKAELFSAIDQEINKLLVKQMFLL